MGAADVMLQDDGGGDPASVAALGHESYTEPLAPDETPEGAPLAFRQPILMDSVYYGDITGRQIRQQDVFAPQVPGRRAHDLPDLPAAREVVVLRGPLQQECFPTFL